MRRASWLVFALFAVLAVPAHAQKKVKEPKRPGINGDKNDPMAYYSWGVAQMDRYPGDAADAFYWAIRLNPGWADAYYARWAALHLADPDQLVLYYQDDEKTIASDDVQRIDSLQLKAMELNPFFYKKFERVMYQAVLEQIVKRQNPQIDQAELNDAVREYTSKGGHITKARNAYILGNLPMALQEWAASLPGWKNKSFPHAERGRIFYMLGAYDSAGAEFASAMKELRGADKKYVVYIYESKALYEQSMGMINEKEDQLDAAREAYGRALQEDLSFAPAHAALGALSLAKGDTAAALSEMEIGAQVAPGDGYLAFIYGRTLVYAGKDAQALEQLKRSAALEPYYPEPHVYLAAIYDASGYTAEATAEYTAFVNLSSQRDARVAKAKARLATLTAQPDAAPAPASPPKP